LSDHTTGQIVIFSLGEEEYALPISYVHEIIRWTSPRTVASGDPSVCGVISLRGKIIPVFDLATRLGLHREHADQAKIVIVETGDDGASTLAGVVVDDVEEVLTVDEDQIDQDGGRTVTGAAIDGIAKIGDRLVVLLSPEQIVATTADVDADLATATAAAPASATTAGVAAAA
jgi:purine-binding chemotaxis protein CheW